MFSLSEQTSCGYPPEQHHRTSLRQSIEGLGPYTFAASPGAADRGGSR